jgi:hypothetical protein
LYFLIFLVASAVALIWVSWHIRQLNKDYEGLLDSFSKFPSCVCDCKPKEEVEKPTPPKPPVYEPASQPKPQPSPVQQKPPKPVNGPSKQPLYTPPASLPTPQNDPIEYKPPKPFN